MNTLLQMAEHSLPDKLSCPPPTQPFEIVLARKISTKGGPLLRTFTALDEDKDGIVNKTDLQIGLQNLFNIDLRDEQINMIFLRFAFINNLSEKGSNHELNGMHFPGFAKYIEITADSHTISTDNMNGAAGFTAGLNQSIISPQSVAAKRKELCKLVYNVIQQNAQSAGDGGMAATYIFLGMDSLRNNRISKDEFGSWLRNRMGLNLSDDELNAVLGDFWNKQVTGGDGITFQQCISFVEYLRLEGMDGQLKDECRDERYKPTQKHLFEESNESMKREDLDDFQIDGNVRETLTEDCTLVESDIEVVNQFRESLHSELKVQKDLFQELTKHQSYYFTEVELKIGINRRGINVSDDQVVRIIKFFGNDEGQIEYFHFVKLLMEKI